MRNLRSLIWAWLVLGGWAGAAYIHVPGDVPRIQDAMNMANVGDTVVVAEGTYAEFLQFVPKNITVTGTNPEDWGVVSRTIVQPQSGFTGPVVQFNGGESPACVLTGITIQNSKYCGILGGNTQATISRCWVRNNASSSVAGGISNCRGLIDRCKITGNYGPTGGLQDCNGIISNCLVADNSSFSNCAGLFNCAGSITHCTIVNNNGRETLTGGVNRCMGTIANCIIWGNTSAGAGGVPIILDIYGSSQPYNSCFSKAVEGNGNIKVDPQLGLGYALKSGSPCIDAGTNTPPVPLSAWDLRGGPRAIDGNGDSVAITDMGAIEYDPQAISLSAEPGRLDFGAAGGVAGLPAKTFELFNLDGGAGSWEIDKGDCAWVTAEPAGGSIGQTAQTISVSVDPAGLAQGEYTCNLGVVVDGTTELVVPVVLHVGKIIRVPQDIPLIQAAIQQAVDWDAIIVSPGTYKMPLDFLGKKIVLRSADPQNWSTVQTTIIDGRCQAPCVTFNKGEGRDSIVEGLTLQLGGGLGTNYGSLNGFMGGGIFCQDSSPTIRRCNISWNGYGNPPSSGQWPPDQQSRKVNYGGGIALIGACQARIEDCLLMGNVTNLRGAAIYANTSVGTESLARSVIERCTIADNFSDATTYKYDVDCTYTATLIRNTIVRSPSNPRNILIANTDQIRFCCFRYAFRYTGGYATVGYEDIACKNGNIVGDPLFVTPYSSSNPPVYDYRLKAPSPCINHGDPGFGGEGVEDMAGNKRAMDGRLDMGAFEFAPEIRVVHPMEGDAWAAGSRHDITWTEYRESVVIVNPGFELSYIDTVTGATATTKDEDVPGWVVGPNSGVAYMPEKFESMPTVHGKLTAFDRGSGVYQLSVDSFHANSRYTLHLFVGCRTTASPITNWQAALTAGDRTTIAAAATQAEFGIPAPGKWIAVSLALETGAEGVDANVGKRIGILLTGAPFVDFDEVSLDAAELAPTATVDVEYSTDNGQNWQAIADDLLDTGSYPWTIASDLASEACQVRAVSSRADFVAVPSGLFAVRPYQAGAAVESRWSTEGHDMQRTGLAADNGPELGCVKWQYNAGSPIGSSVAIGPDERVIVGGEDGKLAVLDSEGNPVWTFSPEAPGGQLQGCWMLNDGTGIQAADCLRVRPGELRNFVPAGSGWVTDPTFGTVLEFDGVDDYVRIVGYKGISGSAARECSAWIKTTQIKADILWWGSDIAAGQRWLIRLQERNGVGVLKAEINGGNIFGSTPINTGQWVHIRVVLPAGKTNSKDILLFVNGVQEPAELASITPIEIQTGSDTDVHIGAYIPNAVYFKGQMHDVRVLSIPDKRLGAGNPSIGSDGTIYVGDGAGVLYAVDSAGQLRWKHQTKGMIATAPAVTGDGRVIFGSVDGTIVALGADGSELWSFTVPGPGKVGGAVVASPAIGRDGNVYVGGLYNGKLYALDPADGHVVWTCAFEAGAANQSRSLANAPAVGPDGTIYATLLNDTRLYAVNPNDGTIAWTANLAGTAGGDYSTDYPTRFKEVYPWATAAVGPDGTIYVAFDDPYLRAVNPNGTIRWVRRIGMYGGFSVSVGANGKIYAAGDDRSLYVLDGDGTILSRFDGSNWLSWPVIGVDETLYVSDFAGTLWAIAPQPCDGKPQRLGRLADITLDGKVRLEDLAELAANWRKCMDPVSPCRESAQGWKWAGTAPYIKGDIDRDFWIGMSDLLAMAERWMSE